MTRYIAMLRGINVSGQKLIKMAELRTSMEKLGFNKVSTYIQSGNILFEYGSKDKLELAAMIEAQIRKVFTFEVPCLVRTADEFNHVLENNPFLKEGKPEDRLYITFLAREPDQEKVDAVNQLKYEPEEFIIKKDIIFFYSPLGYGNAKMNNNFFENKLKVKATTRNWKSVNKLYDLAT